MKTRAAVAWGAGQPLTLEEINQGFELMARGESIRSVVVF